MARTVSSKNDSYSYCCGEGSPVFQCLIETENSTVFSAASQILQQLAPGTVQKVRVVLTDTSKSFSNIWKSVISAEAFHVLCKWQIEKRCRSPLFNLPLPYTICGMYQWKWQDLSQIACTSSKQNNRFIFLQLERPHQRLYENIRSLCCITNREVFMDRISKLDKY